MVRGEEKQEKTDQQTKEKTDQEVLTTEKSAPSEQSSEEQPFPLTKTHVQIIGSLALFICVLVLLPALIADYLSSRLLVPPAQPKAAFAKRERDLYVRTARKLEVFFRVDRNTVLRGWVFRSRQPKKRRLVIYIHDFHGQGSDGLHWVKALTAKGADVFIYDQRAHGQSQGKLGMHPYKQAQDLKKAYKYLSEILQRQWKEPIGLIGEGLGASVALLASKQHRSFQVVMAIDPILKLKTYWQKKLAKYPTFITELTLKRIKRVAGLSYNRTDLKKRVYKLKHAKVSLFTSQNDPIPYRKFCDKLKKCKLQSTPPKPKKTRKNRGKKYKKILHKHEKAMERASLQDFLIQMGLAKEAKKVKKRKKAPKKRKKAPKKLSKKAKKRLVKRALAKQKQKPTTRTKGSFRILAPTTLRAVSQPTSNPSSQKVKLRIIKIPFQEPQKGLLLIPPKTLQAAPLLKKSLRAILELNPISRPSSKPKTRLGSKPKTRPSSKPKTRPSSK